MAETAGFIERHGLWTDEQKRLAEDILARVHRDGIRTIRIGWGDQHGIVRSKNVTAMEFESCIKDGKDFQMVTSIFDTTNHPIVPPFSAENALGVPELIGLPDGILVPDPCTFKVLPWVKDTAWILSDAYLQSGKPMPFSTRAVLRKQIAALADHGLGMRVGLEFEFYLFRMLDARMSPEASGWPPEPPRVEMLNHGYQYLTDNRNDEIEAVLTALQDNLLALGLPLSTIEDEWGPSQLEVTFGVMPALEAADTALLFRSAVKQIARRMGLHASFMAMPKVPNVFPSGWHMHQSLFDLKSGANVFVAEGGESPLSEVGMNYLGGLIAHAGATSLMTTPTVNGYKRQRPDAFAPFKAGWSHENRGAMLRVIGAPGNSGSRIENRVGDPAANPYLYVASQLIAGRDGIVNRTDPGPSAKAAYLAERPLLPRNLAEAIGAFGASGVMKTELGDTFHNYLQLVKRFEWDRFSAAVTDWEQSEYFEMY